MWVSPHHPPAEKRVYVVKRTGKHTVHPECVVLGGSVLCCIWFCWDAAGLVWWVSSVMLIFFQQLSGLDSVC